MFYVGITRLSLKERLDTHVWAGIAGTKAPVYDHLRAMAAAGLLVEIRLIEKNAGPHAEELWIKALLWEGHQLLNVNKTGIKQWEFLRGD